MTVRLRLTKNPLDLNAPFLSGRDLTRPSPPAYRRRTSFTLSDSTVSQCGWANVMRQALAGMLWSKQFFFFDGDNWLEEHQCPPAAYSASQKLPKFGLVSHAQ